MERGGKLLLWGLCLVLLFAAPAQAAGKFRQVTQDEFIQRWNAVVAKESKSLDMPPLFRVANTEKNGNDVVLKTGVPSVQVALDVRKGKVVGFSVSHVFKGDQNILMFRDAADFALMAFTPFWTDAQREKFMQEKMKQATWSYREDVALKAEEKKWIALYTCSPAPRVMKETFEARVSGVGW